MNYIPTFEQFLNESSNAIEDTVKDYKAVKFGLEDPGYPSDAHTKAYFIKVKNKLLQMTKSPKLADEIKGLLGDKEYKELTK